jgi:hypothetical protein
MKRAEPFRNRIVGYGEIDPKDLLANPRNWRIHPQVQQEALQDVLTEVGWVDDVIVNQQTGFVVDGHLRVALALRHEHDMVPVKYVDLTEEEEKLVLATLDPIAALASTDVEKMGELLQGMDVESERLGEVLDQLLYDAGGFDIDREDVKDAVEKGRQDERAKDIDIIYTAGAGTSDMELGVSNTLMLHCCLAVKLGWLYGFQSSSKPCAGVNHLKAHYPQFIDNDYFQYNHDIHLAKVKQWKPKYATVRDVMSEAQCDAAGIAYYDLKQILLWADELAEYAENVIVIPKYDCLDQIPDHFILGYSVPTTHGGTPMDIQMFQGWRVHLLGGSPQKQIAYWQQIPDSVVSLDNNYILKMARFAQFWTTKGSKGVDELHPDLGRINLPYYLSIGMSLATMATYFRRDIELDDPVVPEKEER